MEEKRITAQEIHHKIHQILNIYIEGLGLYSDEQFLKKQDANTWSLGQMYEHISNSSTYFFLANTVRCLEKRKGQIGGDKNQAGDNIYYYGGFPPRKFQVPDGINGGEIVAKSRKEYKKLFAKIIEDSEKLIQSVELTEGNYKTFHPVFNWLNAYEWYFMLEMHLRHHLRQKRELEGLVGLKTQPYVL
jgi:hypothetical protein